ncbi:hypothetical protein [Limosilactobacillus fastidiosus]|uniref:Uncharacterized protein n=1 Tax=Limosilactobacillus fastidiosus TaxID=2759855 RepID=A0A7W3TY31_9LACO|nr:hypothetical protein [Limosilactobacillus fastidiosus]MBB1063178.1 hypothetical protein [Limosilactobacillus fastidiosus]MBB1085406.1 hypothetical protein [Limosilactobacillus fastidiosus]MCD7083708.1 hypothetical protein [Limosilactobacillus fastidiosus]MCD7085388.1 hypothetical protein [Limosilactobacillus fastidiosus]MCD7114847.1 hypothetical protein [Limosilactobacillus fastidiosus]
MIIHSRPSREVQRHRDLEKQIKGNWGSEETSADDERKNILGYQVVKFLIILVGILTFVVMIIGFCQPLTNP